ncbi:unnamed protein product [Zymoseptoria tritici ST99CH_3D7]|uniref:Uncharacterized protein n=1 Tax=Zymoseptoria tritici (strain ST99CH_3D7) TaxID=1276538 RepID=A0A1X7RSE0_ZYMT9|nr:unnamed protein product [Zymoseptoria tritici ST99CH_3D7]
MAPTIADFAGWGARRPATALGPLSREAKDAADNLFKKTMELNIAATTDWNAETLRIFKDPQTLGWRAVFLGKITTHGREQEVWGRGTIHNAVQHMTRADGDKASKFIEVKPNLVTYAPGHMSMEEAAKELSIRRACVDALQKDVHAGVFNRPEVQVMMKCPLAVTDGFKFIKSLGHLPGIDTEPMQATPDELNELRGQHEAAKTMAMALFRMSGLPRMWRDHFVVIAAIAAERILRDEAALRNKQWFMRNLPRFLQVSVLKYFDFAPRPSDICFDWVSINADNFRQPTKDVYTAARLGGAAEEVIQDFDSIRVLRRASLITGNVLNECTEALLSNDAIPLVLPETPFADNFRSSFAAKTRNFSWTSAGTPNGSNISSTSTSTWCSNYVKML